MPDNPDYDKDSNNAVDDPPDDEDEFFATLSANKARNQGEMIIDLQRVGSTWSLVVKVGGAETYKDTDFNPGAIGQIMLQSHWGSGVRFTSMSVEEN